MGMYNKRSKRKSGGARRRGDRRSRLNRRSRVNRRSRGNRRSEQLRGGAGETEKTGLKGWIDKKAAGAASEAAREAMSNVKDMYEDAFTNKLPTLMGANTVTDMSTNIIKHSLAEVVKILPPTINNMSRDMLSNLAMGVLVSTQGRERVELNLKIKGLAEELSVDPKYFKTDEKNILLLRGLKRIGLILEINQA